MFLQMVIRTSLAEARKTVVEKKFKAGKMKELLLSIKDKSMEEQKNSINKAFESWKGELEQIDDVCVMGFRV